MQHLRSIAGTIQKGSGLTFDADDMFSYLLLYQHIWNGFDQIVQSIDAGVYTFKSLDFLPDSQRITQIRISRIHLPAIR